MTLSRRILDFFFPRICPICGGRLSLSEELLCLECRVSLPRTRCHENPTDNEMKNLFELQIAIERAVAFMRYMPNAVSANLIKECKYANGKAMSNMVGRFVAKEYAATSPHLFDDVDVIVPVPLVPSRKRERGFNQSEVIARGFSSITGIPVDAQSVKRQHFHKSQTYLSDAERMENVKDAFKCVKPDRLSGKHILLLDDTITTGATIISLANAIMDETKDVKFSVLTIGIAGEFMF